MSDSEQQRRHLARIAFDAGYRIQAMTNASRHAGHIIDLSLKGALLERPANLNLDVGDKLVLELLLGGDDIQIQMQVRVAHLHERSIGVVCEHLDLDSMSHLCRFLELNLGSHVLLERELSEMLQLNTP